MKKRNWLINNGIRNRIKDFYYKYFYYDFPIKWHKNYAEATVMGEKIKMIYFSDKSKYFYDSKYYNDFICLNKKNFGYFHKYKPQEGDIVIDAGAYEGAFAILVAKMVGKRGKVIAFEPEEKAFERLKQNIKLNNLINLIPIKKGLWNSDSSVKFKSDGEASSIFREGEDKIEVVSLDNELKRLGIKEINYIKMDVEGAEIEAIKGCKNTLKKNDVNLAIASYHIIDGEKTYKKLEKELKKLNYKTKTSFPSHLITYASKK